MDLKPVCVNIIFIMLLMLIDLAKQFVYLFDISKVCGLQRGFLRETVIQKLSNHPPLLLL